MKNKIKILHLEDQETDAHLVSVILKKMDLDVEIMVVDYKEAYVEALFEFGPDVILSDHSLPSFNSNEALNIFKQSGVKIPFILVTGAISEEYAVSLIKAGADDYILKSQLEKLPEAIINSLEKIESEINMEIQELLKIKEKTNGVLIAQEAERSRMGYELLENINQILAASNLYVDCALSEEDKRMVFMQNSKKYILMAIDEIKNLSQVIMPPTLEEIGLLDSLNNWLAFKRKQNGINVFTEWKNFDATITSNKLQLAIYRIVQDQVNSIVKHSSAQNIYVSLEQSEDNLWLIVKDDGIGFDNSAIRNDLSLKNINTKVEIHSGRMLINSAPGKGCTLTIIFPT